MSPGDEVICVSASPFCPNCDNEPMGEFPMPEVGRHYVVGMVGECWCGGCHHQRPGMRPAGSVLPWPQAWPQHWFRRLEYDEDKNIADAGVTLPVRIKEVVDA